MLKCLVMLLAFFALSISIKDTICLTLQTKTKKAIVIGASSGMGRQIAKLLSKEGYLVGLCARRLPLLESLQEEMPGPSKIKAIDVSSPNAREKLQELISELEGLDLIVISISAYLDNRPKNETNSFNCSAEWAAKERTLNVDSKGFIAMADVAIEFFKKQGYGHLAGISSTSGQRGVAYNPAYSAAKASNSYYMEAMRNYMKQNNINIQITDIVPGYVAVEHSPLGQDPAAYWEINAEKAAKIILDGIKTKSKVVYVPSKVRFIAFLLKHLPDWLYNNYFSWL